MTDKSKDKSAVAPRGVTEGYREAPIRGGRRSRDKGNRIEREIVDRHKSLGVHAERYPLSGASRFRGSGHDIDVYVHGQDQAPIVCEVKGRKDGAGFATLERWLGEFDALFLRRNNAEPLVALPWRTWAALLAKRIHGHG
jgi:Holliday junction resolvase